MSEWQSIETCPIPIFDPKKWYENGPHYLVFSDFVQIAYYGYTQTGKGRWQGRYHIISPTHWMPLPKPPK